MKALGCVAVLVIGLTMSPAIAQQKSTTGNSTESMSAR